MRIEDTHIQQASRHHVEGHGKKEGFDSVKERRDHGHHHDEKAVHRGKRPDSVAISDEARARFESMHKRSSEARGREFSVPAGLDKAGFLGRLVQGAFSGQEINISDIARAGKSSAPDASRVEDLPALSASNGFTASVEQLTFSASGTIKTADGEEVGFTLELNMTKASMSGFSSSASGDAQSPMTVNYAGSSSELFSMSFKFNISSEEGTEAGGAQDGTGLLTVDRIDEASGGIDEEHSVDAEEDGVLAKPSLSVPDFFKALRKAEFTSTYLSFSRTTIEASSSLAVAQGAPMDGFLPGVLPSGSSQPLDLLV